MRMWWFDYGIICIYCFLCKLGRWKSNQSFEWAPMAEMQMLPSTIAWWASRHTSRITDGRQQGDRETVTVSRWDSSRRSSQGWRVLRKRDDRQGDDRHDFQRSFLNNRLKFWCCFHVQGMFIYCWSVLLKLNCCDGILWRVKSYSRYLYNFE